MTTNIEERVDFSGFHVFLMLGVKETGIVAVAPPSAQAVAMRAGASMSTAPSDSQRPMSRYAARLRSVKGSSKWQAKSAIAIIHGLE